MSDIKSESMLVVKLIKSVHGRIESHKACVRGLGLRKIGGMVQIQDTAEVRGMISKVRYLLEVQSVHS